jgi:hypothetical protein
MEKVQSKDGTTIAFDQLGEGAPLVLVAGASCDRSIDAPIAEELARHFTVLNYDRRGRGDRGDTLPFASSGRSRTSTCCSPRLVVQPRWWGSRPVRLWRPRRQSRGSRSTGWSCGSHRSASI